MIIAKVACSRYHDEVADRLEVYLDVRYLMVHDLEAGLSMLRCFDACQTEGTEPFHVSSYVFDLIEDSEDGR